MRPAYLVEIQPKGEGLPRPNALVCRYEFADRTSVEDLTRNAIDQVAAVGVTFRHSGRSKEASAIYFDGSARLQLDEIDLPDTGWAVAFTVKAYETGASQHIWQLSSNSGTDLDRLTIYIAATGEVGVRLSDGTTTDFVESTEQVSFGVWQHVLVSGKTVIGTDTAIRIHIENGSSGGGVIAGLTLPQPTTGFLHFLGTDRDTGPVFHEGLLGFLDNLEIWNEWFEDNDIASTYRWATNNRFRALSGDTSLDNYPLSIADVKPIESAFDVVENLFSQSELQIEALKDGWFAGLVRDYRLRGATVRISLGDQRLLGTGEFAPQFTGVIVDWIPHKGGHKIRVKGRTTHLLETRKITGNFVGHPLEVSQAVIQAAVDAADAGLTIDDLADLETLDPSTYTTFSHWNVARAGRALDWSPGNSVYLHGLAPRSLGAFEDGIHEPTSALSVLRDLWRVLPHRFLVDSDDRISFVEFDQDKSADELWFEEDILDVEVQDVLGNLVNHLEMEINVPGGSGESRELLDRREGTTQAPGVFRAPLKSQASIDANGIEVKKKMSSEWLGGLHYNDFDFTGGMSDPGPPLVDRLACIDLPPGYAGVSGFALSEANRVVGGTQEDWRKVDAGSGRFLWIMSAGSVGSSPLNDPRFGKVIEIHWDESWSPVSMTEAGFWPLSDRATMSVVVPQIRYDVEWGQFGLDDSLSASGYMVDATIPVAFAEYYLRRFENGCPIIQVDTHLYKYARQIGDFVAIEWPHIEMPEFGATENGITQTTVWEIVGKSIQVFGEQPRVRWTLAWVRNDTADPVSLEAGEMFKVVRPDEAPPDLFEYLGAPTPSLTSSPSSFEIELDDDGVLRFGTNSWALPALELTISASKTTLIYFSTVTRAYVIREIDTSDPNPTDVPASEALIWDIDTDGSGVVVAAGLPEDGGLAGSSIGGLSVGSGQIAAEAVDDTKTVRTKRATLTTTDATTTAIASIPVTDNTALMIEALIVGRKSDGSDHAAIQQIACVHRAGGGAVVDAQVQAEDVTGNAWDASFVASGDNVELRVTGAAATTVNWTARIRWEEAA